MKRLITFVLLSAAWALGQTYPSQTSFITLGDANTWTATQTAPGFVATGTTAGFFQCTAGTANGHATASTYTLECPSSVTAYEVEVPGAAATGFPYWTNSSGVVTESIVASPLTASYLAAQYSKGSCTEVWGGTGTSNVLQAGDDAISDNTCYNDSGVTRTITAVKCRADYASATTTVNPTFGSAGTGTTVCSGALTCGSSLAYSSSCTVSHASWGTGTGINPVQASPDGHSTSIAMIVEYTY